MNNENVTSPKPKNAPSPFIRWMDFYKMKTSCHVVIFSSISLLFLLSIFPCFIEADTVKTGVKCSNFKYTGMSVYDFYGEIQKFATKGTLLLSSKTMGKSTQHFEYCEKACTAWLCVVNNVVFYGGGCYPEFKKTCKMSTRATSGNIDSKLDEIKYEPYTFVSIFKEKIRPYQANVNLRNEIRDGNKYLEYFKNVFLGVSVTIVTSPTTTTAPNTDTSTISNNDNDIIDQFNDGLMNQINSFKFFVLFGFIIFAQI